jgi:glycosyltransferase involved in cell wall biosynthesis
MLKKKRPDLSVIVAAYNEEMVIADNARKIIAYMEANAITTWELVLVDDGSSDATWGAIEKLAREDQRVITARHRRNYGQGRALRSGYEISSGDVIVTLDADLSYGPEYIQKLTAALETEKADIAIASAYMKGGAVINVPFMRRILSKWGNRYLSRMSMYDIATSTCVVRAYRREVFEEVFLTSDGMEMQLEILMKSAMAGFKAVEIPADLVWSAAKSPKSSTKRFSKMRILRSIKLYLMIGWLSKPAYFFILASMSMILPGVYMALWAVYRVLLLFGSNYLDGVGLRWSISYALSLDFTRNIYSYMISGALIIIGLQMLSFALLAIQNKFYFEELYKISHRQPHQRRGSPD